MRARVGGEWVLLAAGLSQLVGCGRKAAAEEAPAAAPVVAAQVQTAVVEERVLPTYVPLTGQLVSGRQTELAANGAGRVTATRVERGSRVKAGDVLATLDTRMAALSAAEARASAATVASQAQAAKTECDRARSLLASGAIAPAEWDRLDAQCRASSLSVTAAEARTRLASQSVSDGVIRAPFDGFISERYVDVGEYVQPSSRVVSLVDLGALRVESSVPETYLDSVKTGTRVSFTVASQKDRVFGAVVKFVSAAVRPETRDVVAEAVVDEADASELRPGMFASLRLPVGEAKQAVVPAAALTLRDGKQAVFVLVGDHVEQRLVQRGDAVGSSVVLGRGVAAGERVVLSPAADLKNGQPAR